MRRTGLAGSPLAVVPLEEICGGAHVISVIGSGGKTTFIETLARQLRRRHPGSIVAISTTTRQWPPSQLPLIADQPMDVALEQLGRLGLAYVADTCLASARGSQTGADAAARHGSPLRAGSSASPSSNASSNAGPSSSPGSGPSPDLDTDPTSSSHLGTGPTPSSNLDTGPTPSSNPKPIKLREPSWGIGRLASAVVESGGYLLVEADGSRGLPLKAHAVWEPAVPAATERCVLVVGASGFGRPVATVVHRPELFCERTGCSLETPSTPETIANEIAFEVAHGLMSFDSVFVNQVDLAHVDPALLTTAAASSVAPRSAVTARSIAQEKGGGTANPVAFTSALRKKGISSPVWFGSAREGQAILARPGSAAS